MEHQSNGSDERGEGRTPIYIYNNVSTNAKKKFFAFFCVFSRKTLDMAEGFVYNTRPQTQRA